MELPHALRCPMKILKIANPQPRNYPTSLATRTALQVPQQVFFAIFGCTLTPFYTFLL